MHIINTHVFQHLLDFKKHICHKEILYRDPLIKQIFINYDLYFDLYKTLSHFITDV